MTKPLKADLSLTVLQATSHGHLNVDDVSNLMRIT